MKYDKALLDGAGLQHTVSGNSLKIMLPEHHCDPVEVMLDASGEMDLVVDRSHTHRVIAGMLGLPVPKLPDGMK